MGARAKYGSHLRGGDMATKQDDRMFESEFSDVTLDELREFLEADIMDVKADPEFKERLRKMLWDLVQVQAGRPQSNKGEC